METRRYATCRYRLILKIAGCDRTRMTLLPISLPDRQWQHSLVDLLSDRTPPLRRLAAIGAAMAALTGVELWLWTQYGSQPWAVTASNVAIEGCFAAAGMLAWRLRPRSRTGPWMLVMALALSIANLNTGFAYATEMPGREVTVLLGLPAYWMQFVVGARLFLTYPTGRLTSVSDRRMVAVGFAVSLVGAVLLLLTKTPLPLCAEWCGRSPLAVTSDPGLYLSIRTVLLIFWIVLAAIVLVIVARRTIRAAPRRRRALTLMTGAAAFTILLLLAQQLRLIAIYAAGATSPVADYLGIGMGWAAVVALPVAFLLGLLRERLEFASVGSLVGELASVSADRVETALREVLRDPGLRMAFPIPGGLLDASGQPFEPEPDQASMPLGDPPVAILFHDPELAEQRDLLGAAGAAARLALDNARLNAEVRAQLTEIRAASQRVVAAADAERQRLERDLHDGAQQRLLGVGMALGSLRQRLGDADQEMVNELEDELRVAIRELRDIAHGIRPAVLTDQGLAPALAGLARQCAIPVVLDVHVPHRLDPSVEATAYYIVSEALQNVAKHSGATSAQIHVADTANGLIIDIHDDGRGGAAVQRGTGLHGLADRAEAAGGRFELSSSAGTGTHLHIELPVERSRSSTV